MLKSCDVVTRASAGGRFLRIQEADTPPIREGGLPTPPTPDAQPHRTHADTIQEGQDTTVTAAETTAEIATEQLTIVREDGTPPQTGEDTQMTTTQVEQSLATPSPISRPVESGLPGPWPSGGPERPGAEGQAAGAAPLAQIREAQVRLECAHHLRERLAAADLPEPVKAKLQRTWDPFGAGALGTQRWDSGQAYVRALESALDAEVDMLAALRRATGWTTPADSDPAGQGGDSSLSTQHSSLVQGLGAARPDVGLDGASRGRAAVQVALDRLFGVRESEDDADLTLLRRAGVRAPRWTGLREAYAQITGDAGVTGLVQPALSIVREANEVTTTVLNYALLNSMTKRLVQDYEGQPQDWRRFCVVRAIKDFKSQDRIRLFDFASLSTVAEGAAYTNLAWDDAKEAYTPAKKGNMVVVTREAILNDDLDSIRKIPTKLAVAAGITMNEFVYGLFTTNPAMADTTKVFDDGVQTSHGNRGTTALSSSSLQAAITAMMKQTNSAGKRLNLRPRYLLVPPDLLFTALAIVNSTLVPGSANNDANLLKGAVEPISVAQFTDVTDWYLIADPALVESIEIGFVGGRESPDLLLQDAPATGAVFTNDQISYRIRWEFGGGWLDYRGAFWAQVAG